MPRRLAFLLFQSHRKGSYLHDGAISIMSGRLRAVGVDNDVFETVFDGEHEEENDRLIGRLTDAVVAGNYDLLAVTRLWDPEIIRKLRAGIEASGAPVPKFVFLPQKAWGESVDPYDLVNPTMEWRVLDALARAPEPLDADTVPGILLRDGGEFRESRAPNTFETEPEEPWKLRPNFRRIRINPEIKPKSTHLVVYGNPGCPYRRSIREVPAWKDIELDPDVTNTRGCSFCNINLASDYRFIKDIAEHVVQQVINIQDADPDTDLVILLDQDPFPYLPAVFEGMIAAGCRPFHLLIQARADLFIRRKEKYERALELARSGGFRCTPFLVGVENFHQPTLDFYNKGVTVEMNIEVLRYLRDTAARFPTVVDPDHVSPGFILWHPWVTFESLRTNVTAILEHGFTEFRSEVALSKIRLYPDIPFYWKAKEDGLLESSYADVGLDSARRYGYPEEAPYRFAHAEAQVAYTILAALCRKYEPIEELRLLALVLDWVEALGDGLSSAHEVSLEAPERLVASFEDERGDDVQKLRKSRGSSRRSRVLGAVAEAELRGALAPYWPGAGPGPDGFELARVVTDSERVQLFFATTARAAEVRTNPRTADFRLIIEPRSDSPAFLETDDWSFSYASSLASPEIKEAIARIGQTAAERLSAPEVSALAQEFASA